MQVIDNSIYVGANLIDDRVFLRQLASGRKVLVVSDTNASSLYLSVLLDSLSLSECKSVILPSGEACKTFASIELIIAKLVHGEYDRSSLIIALGGGVVCDLAAFAASIFMRGTNLILIPTTLLAQIDAGIGGKTGCNHLGIKNLLGTFYLPEAIIIDYQLTQTISDREYSSALAEVIKYGVSLDAEFFAWLEDNKSALRARDPSILPYIIERCCKLKMQVVHTDLRDQKSRWKLNFGHTFAHAIESVTNFSKYTHGEAVAIGMMMATSAALKLGLVNQEIMDRLGRLLVYLGLPVKVDSSVCSTSVLCDYMKRDKKSSAGRVNLVLPRAIGEVVLHSIIMDREYEDVCLKMTDISMVDIGDSA